MELFRSSFDTSSVARITHLMNKTNQFNLTTRRYTEIEVMAMLELPEVVTLQLRLTDAYGDDGIIGLVVGRLVTYGVLELDSWLMSCRVLGRKVQEATLQILAAVSAKLGFSELVGVYRPTAKNGMVAQQYSRLGFVSVASLEEACTRWSVSLNDFTPFETPISIMEGKQ